MPVIYVKNLVVEARHGVHEREKEQPQRFVFNVEATIDSPAGTSDELSDTLNYSDLRNLIVETATTDSFNLLERLAKAVADRIIAADSRVKKVVISIDKPDIFDNGVPGVRLEVTA